MKAEICILLRRYLDHAQQVTAELCSSLNVTDLLSAVNSGVVPRRGHCPCFGGGEYYVHGVGCRLLAAEIEIDFDFGANGTVPGADPWKLYNFADAHLEAFPWLPPRSTFNECIEHLIADGALRISKEPPSPHLVCPN